MLGSSHSFTGQQWSTGNIHFSLLDLSLLVKAAANKFYITLAGSAGTSGVAGDSNFTHDLELTGLSCRLDSL